MNAQTNAPVNAEVNAGWQDFLIAAGARMANAAAPEILDFGNAPGELLAAQDGTILSPLTHLGLIACDGDEAKTFLHNQVTSDINHLASDAAQYSAWCSAKGRMLASFLIYREAGDYRLLLSADLVPSIAKRLQMFVLRAKVKIADLSTSRVVLGVAGPQAEAALVAAGLPVPAQPLQTATSSEASVIRLHHQRFQVIVLREAAQSLWTKLATLARPAGPPAWMWLQVEAGVPLISEATREEFVPQMLNFEQLGGVSFHKGCYPGQEVVARTQYLGKVKRHLYRLRSSAPLAVGGVVYSPENAEQPCGTVVNAAPAPSGGYVALAVLQIGRASCRVRV